MRLIACVLAIGIVCAHSGTVRAQKPPDPEVGYVFPPGGRRGTTVEVKLAGFDWTPDLQYFVLDPRIGLIVDGALSRHLMPEPPFPVGMRAYGPPPLPREVAARIVIPGNVPSGPVRWQVANANGTSNTAVFVVGEGAEVVEDRQGGDPQILEQLPVTVSGRLARYEEVDCYLIEPQTAGPVTCELVARRLGSNFHAVLEIRDTEGRLVADAVDSQGMDLSLTFSARAGSRYRVCVRDLNFRGHRACVYRLTVSPEPRALAEAPTAGRRREPREIVSLEVPVAVTGSLDRLHPGDRYRLAGQSGDVWKIAVQARQFGSPLDVALAILGPDGKGLAANDDLAGTTDAGLEFVVPSEGDYDLVVSDISGAQPSPLTLYRLIVERAQPDFALRAPQHWNVPIGDKSELVVNVTRTGGFKGPVALAIAGLPEGISLPAELSIPGDQDKLKIALQSAADAPSGAALVTITGSAHVGEQTLTRTAQAQAAGNLATRSPTENLVSSILIASTMKPVTRIRPIESDERTVHRGTFHLAELSIERLPNFSGAVVVQMDSRQPVKFRQGIVGPDVIVAPGVDRVFYPCLVPDVAETTDAYRILLEAVAQVPDSRGNVRYLISKMQADDASVAITVEGALMKISAGTGELAVRPGTTFLLPVRIARSPKLAEAVCLEIRPSATLAGQLSAEPVVVPPGKGEISMPVRLSAGKVAAGRHVLTIRATALQPGQPPMLSESANASPMDRDTIAILKAGHLPVVAEAAVEFEIVADE